MTLPPLTAQLAKIKKLPLAFLDSLGVKDCPSGISIQYRLRDGSLAPRQRIRRGLRAKDGFSWTGKGEVGLYGLWRLK